jgi:hypothetical protein
LSVPPISLTKRWRVPPYNVSMTSHDRSLEADAERGELDEDAAEQLRHAASALARMPRGMADAITSTRHVERDQVVAFARLARLLAAEHGLGLLIQPGDPMSVRFYRGVR